MRPIKAFGFMIMMMMATLFTTGCAARLHDLSGLAKDGKGNIYSVNNRPGVFVKCERMGDKLDCERLPYKLTTYERYDLEGIVWIEGEFFYVVSEKRDNICAASCALSQDILLFRIDHEGMVEAGHCAPFTIPVFESDDADCPYANCGLEGIAYDSQQKLLYIAKERKKRRLFKVPLNENLCPSGTFEEITPPEEALPVAFSDLYFSKARQSLFILDSRGERFYEWKLSEERIGYDSNINPKVKAFILNNIPTEGIYIDDAKNEAHLLAENGAFLIVPLNKE